MSLLNQVLQDLQERQAPDVNTAQATLRDVHIPVRSGARSARRPWVLWTAIILLAGVSGSLLWQRGWQDAAPPTTANAPEPTHVAAPTTTVAAPRTAEPTSVAPEIKASGPLEASTATAEPERVAPVTKPSVADAVAPVAAPIVTPDPPPAPMPQVPAETAAKPTVAAETKINAASDATAAPAIITAPVRASATLPRSVGVEKTARPLSPEQQATLTYQDAMRLLRSGRPSAAEPRLHDALDAYPAQHAARTALAGLLINAGRLPEATSVLAAGLALAPDHAPFAKLYARLRIDQGELDDARAVLERAATTAQNDPEYHALLAALYQRLSLFPQAAQAYRGALQAQPRNGVWWLGLGMALEGAGERANALQAYQRAQQSGTLDSEVLRYVESKITALR